MSTPRSLHVPDGVFRTVIRIPRGELAALVAPPAAVADDAPVLLVPGFTGSKEDFLPILPALGARGHHAVAIDQRGQYESPGDDDPAAYDVKQLADDVLAVARELGAPVHLVGHSFGGLIVRAAALADPGAVRSLTLMGSGPAAIPEPASIHLGTLVQALPALELAAIWPIKRQLELAGRPGPEAEIEDFLQRRFLANSRIGLQRMAEQLLCETDCVDEVAALQLPTLVMFGVTDDAWPTEVQREMAVRLRAVVAEVPGAGHSPAIDNPDETSDILLRFWQEPRAPLT